MSTTERWRRNLVAGAGLLVAVQVAFFALLVIGQLVPDRPIVQNLVSSVEEGTYGPSFLPDRMGSMSDTFTECVVVGTGLGAPPEESVLSRAVRMPRLSNCESGQDQILALAAGGEVVQDSYFKYWAGYTVLTRPVLATIGMEGLRLISGAMLAVGLLTAFLGLRAHVNQGVAIVVTGAFVLGTNVLSTPSTSFSQALSIAVIFGSVALTARWGAQSWERAGAALILAAAVFCFVDLLTTPAIPWALCSFTLGAVAWTRWHTPSSATAGMLLGLVLWPVAFGATWVSRWLITAIFLGPGYTFDVVRSNVEFRTSGAHEDVPEWFGAALASNVGYWGVHIPTWWLVAAGCLGAMAFGLPRIARYDDRSSLLVATMLSVPALVIPVWYLVVANHSLLHEFFASRGVPTFLSILAAAALASKSGSRHDLSATDEII